MTRGRTATTLLYCCAVTALSHGSMLQPSRRISLTRSIALTVRGGASKQQGRRPTVSPIDLAAKQHPYIYLPPRTERAERQGVAASSAPVHLKFAEYLLADGVLAAGTLLSLAVLANAALFTLAGGAGGAPAGSGSRANEAWYLRQALLLAAARHGLELARAGLVDARVNLLRDGLHATREKARGLARSAACKYAAYACFFLLFCPLFAAAAAPVGSGAAGGKLGGATAARAASVAASRLGLLCLVPLIAREAVALGWTARDALQWIAGTPGNEGGDGGGDVGSDGGGGADEEAEGSCVGGWVAVVRGGAGAAVGAVCGHSAAAWAELGDGAQAALLAKRLQQVKAHAARTRQCSGQATRNRNMTRE